MEQNTTKNLENILKNSLGFFKKYKNDTKFQLFFHKSLKTQFKWQENTHSNIFYTKNLEIDLPRFLKSAIKCANAAKEAILRVSADNLSVENKKDGSPVSNADMNSHKALMGLGGFPILSEENVEMFLKNDKLILPDIFWLIDPLDGTKEYLRGGNEYCVCVTLVYFSRPILGVILGVKNGEMLASCVKTNVIYQNNEKITIIPNAILQNENMYQKHNKTIEICEKILKKNDKTAIKTEKNNDDDLFCSDFKNILSGKNVLASKSSADERGFFENLGANCVLKSSALKFVDIALCKTHAHLRVQNLGLWDICAGEFLIFACGGGMFGENGFLKYDRVRMPHFGAFSKNIL